jgi:anhydro-N-acetylmuramic acid kinase
MNSKEQYKITGLMSGTSLDGVDIAHCVFKKNGVSWSYRIEKASTVKYNREWLAKLQNAHSLSGEALIDLDHQYGKYLGKISSSFLEKNNLKPDFIASHGHTVFHQPKKGFTYQIGNGNALYAVTGIPVVYDFRSLDVIRGGEGAPLVPAGDKFLFSEYEICLNLGGIANLSMDIRKQRIAFDICFVNMGLNYLAAKAGKVYDKNGDMSAAGELNSPLLKSLDKVYNSLRKKRPSLGREIFEKEIRPLLDNEHIPLADKLRTFTESSAKEIVLAIRGGNKPQPKVLCCGGGAFNSFLVSRMLEFGNDDMTFIVPDEEIVKFKEAMVFAFLGLLRVRDEVNCLKSVTGAPTDSSSGVLVGF